MSKKISFFLPSAGGGGAERVIIRIANHLSNKDYQVDLVLAQAVGENLQMINKKVNIVDLKKAKPLKAIPLLIKYLRRVRPEVLMSTVISANVAALLANLIVCVHTRLIVREASTLSSELKNSTAFNRFVLSILIRFLYPCAETIIAPSKGVANDLAKLIRLKADKLYVIYNPVISIPWIQKAQSLPTHSWIRDKKDSVILGIGRLHRQKGFDTLIRAFVLVRRQISVKLIILGEGEERASLEQLTISEGVRDDVSFPGFIKNPYGYLLNASIFVLSSRWEGLPGVLIEALACGIKVVATDCPNGPREILDNGKYGQLCPVEDVSCMARAIIRALKGEYIASDPTAWINLFSLEANLKHYLNLLIR